MEYETTVHIEAPPEKVWAVLTDVESWPEWTASMTNVERLDSGEFGMGSKARIKQPGFPRLVWEVTRLAPGSSFAWEAKSAGMTTVADHRISPTGHGSTATVSISQRGPLAGLNGLLLRRRTRRYLEQEAQGLKRHVEGGAERSP